MDQRGWRTYFVSIPAGGEEFINQMGEFFYVIAATADFEIGLDDDAPDFVKVGVEGRLKSGQTFEKLRLKNPGGSAVAVRIAAGFGQYSDSEAQVSGGIDRARSSSLTVSSVIVGTSAVPLATADTGRKSLTVQNLGPAPVYLGGAGVTVADGLRVAAGAAVLIDWTTAAVYGIADSAGQDIRVWED